MNETELNAKFAALCKQRDNSQNEAVNLYGALAVTQARIKELEAQLAAKDGGQVATEGAENV